MQPQEDEFLLERQNLQDFLYKLDNEIDRLLEDYENVNLDKLFDLNELIEDNYESAKIIGSDFLEEYEKFKTNFNHFYKNFDDSTRFKKIIDLEDFLDQMQVLKQKLFY
ncbi:MAG: hypothetical protein JXA94_07305 [Parachlamydiales bacterium]|nr:hypothetical protein [Parachlamydiales bacterium]